MNKRQRKKWLKQRDKYISNSDLWNLDVTISEWILPRLKKFKELEDGCPNNIDSYEEWHEALDKMIYAFELTSNVNIPDRVKHREEIQEGLHLFADWFQALWI